MIRTRSPRIVMNADHTDAPDDLGPGLADRPGPDLDPVRIAPQRLWAVEVDTVLLEVRRRLRRVELEVRSYFAAGIFARSS